MIGEAGKQDEVLDLLKKETEGNVFFLVEVVRALAEEAGRLDQIGTQALPHSIITEGTHGILTRRLAKIGDAAYPILETAAVAGRVIDEPLLERLHPDLDLEDWLYECAYAAVLEVQNGRWRFAHDKLREVVLETLEDAAFASINAQVATAIEAVYPDDERYVMPLANHWHAAGDTEKIHYYAPLAGKLASTLTSYMEASRFYEMGFAATETDSLESAVLLAGLGNAQSYLGQFERSIVNLEAALALARTYGDRELIDRCYLSIVSSLSLQSDFANAERYARNALAEVGHYHLELHTKLAAIMLRQSRMDEAQVEIQKASEQLAPGEVSERKGDVLNQTGWLYINRGEFQRAKEVLLESAAIVHSLGLLRLYSASLVNLSNVLINLNEFDEAYRRLEEAHKIVKRFGIKHHESVTLSLMARIAREQGNLDLALEKESAGLAIRRAVQDHWGMTFSLLGLGEVYRKQRDYEAAIPAYEEVWRISQEKNIPYNGASARLGLGFIALELAELESARDHFVAVLGMKLSSYELSITAIYGLSNWFFKSGDLQRAAELAGFAALHIPSVEGLDPMQPLWVEASAGLEDCWKRGAEIERETMVESLLTELNG
jgi:tetratricopeptide (TPR) repeat protein